jgi:hypothetical protein
MVLLNQAVYTSIYQKHMTMTLAIDIQLTKSMRSCFVDTGEAPDEASRLGRASLAGF